MGRLKRRGEDDIKKALKILCVGVDTILLTQNRNQWQVLVNTVMNLPDSMRGG
jgi:hypothetical protein